MAQASRTRLPSEDRRAQLIALGVESLARRPLHDLTIDALAAEAGVSRPLLFHYFGSKQGLHREVVRVARDSMLHATRADAELEPLDRLHDTLTRIVRFVREHRGTFSSLVRGVASGDVEVREVVAQARLEQAERVIAVFVERGMADTPMLRIAMRSWVSFAEETLVETVGARTEDGAGADDAVADAELVAFLHRSAQAVAQAVTESTVSSTRGPSR